MSFHIQSDWLPLVGEVVEVRLRSEYVRRGIVDAVTNDNSILWLAVDGVNPRTMVQRWDGYEIWIDYKWEKPAKSPAVTSAGAPLLEPPFGITFGQHPTRTEELLAKHAKSRAGM